MGSEVLSKPKIIKLFDTTHSRRLPLKFTLYFNRELDSTLCEARHNTCVTNTAYSKNYLYFHVHKNASVKNFLRFSSTNPATKFFGCVAGDSSHEASRAVLNPRHSNSTDRLSRIYRACQWLLFQLQTLGVWLVPQHVVQHVD